MFKILVTLSLAAIALADNVAVQSWQFERITPNGYPWAVVIAAPMWHMPMGTCMPSAAEDGAGHQTHGAAVYSPRLITNTLDDGCPVPPQWYGARTEYRDVDGEPFEDIPTYFKVAKCEHDQSWRVLYSVYFKADATHKSDWEGAMVIWRSSDGGNWWTRDSIRMARHQKQTEVAWEDLPNTYDGFDNADEDGIRNGSHPKLYFGKWKHATFKEPQTTWWKNTYNGDPDFRNDDYFFVAHKNLRNAADPSILNPSWVWGTANSPAAKDGNGNDKVNLCTW